ncbi:MAG: hypothetical protein FWG79_00390 [Bacteroidales bacterium]|nr:hypothetical protein [Bacteroidales bacterium]
MKKPKLVLSPAFTLEDIRKIRDYNYEMTKDMTEKERSAYYKKREDAAMKRFERSLARIRAEHNVAAEPVFEYKKNL